jgi:hypothetical protein
VARMRPPGRARPVDVAVGLRPDFGGEECSQLVEIDWDLWAAREFGFRYPLCTSIRDMYLLTQVVAWYMYGGFEYNGYT